MQLPPPPAFQQPGYPQAPANLHAAPQPPQQLQQQPAPPALASPQPPAGTPPAASDNKGSTAQAWTAHKAGSGQVYYYNTLTKESAWSKPEGYAGDESGVAKPTKPLSHERVKGTDWSQVKCEDGKVYYYNITSRDTTWTVPAEVEAAQAAAQVKEEGGPGSVANGTIAVAAHASPHHNITHHPTAPSTSPGQQYSSISPAAPDASRQPAQLQQAVSQQVLSQQARPPAIPPAAQPRSIPEPRPPPGKPPAEIEADFTSLLEETGVTAFSRWERELPKMLADPRFTAVTSIKERRSLFDVFCRSAADRHKKPKIDRTPAARDAFMALLNEAQALAQDGHVDDGEKEEGEEGAEKALRALTASSTYDRLQEGWQDDPRWKDCDEKLRKDYFEARIVPLKVAAARDAEARKAAVETDFRALLAEKGANAGSRWHKLSHAMAKDRRYRALHKDLREPLFKAYLAEKQAAEAEAQQERKMREEREGQAKRRLQASGEEAEARRRKAAHTSACQGFQTLLNEVVKDPEARWTDWKPRLDRDPQGRATNPHLELKEPELFFKDHVVELGKRACAGYIEMLAATLKPLLGKAPAKGEKEDRHSALSTFAGVEPLLAEDPRFLRAPASEREKLWRRYVQEIVQERDDPRAAERRRGRLSSQGQATAAAPARERDSRVCDRGTRDTTVDGVDRAYQREYHDVDRKRMRRG